MLSKLLDAIAAPADGAAAAAQRHLDTLTKPPGSLGRLEELAVKLVALRGTAPTVDAPVVFVLVADHGVVAERVSAYPQTVTAQMVENFIAGGAAINVLARQAGARVVVADFGVAREIVTPALVSRRIGAGTANMAVRPAMTRAQAISAIEAGAKLAMEQSNADLFATGEMGIGNTTAASAITAAMTGADAGAVTGRGTGVDDETWSRKAAVVRRALAINAVDPRDPIGVLAGVGGFEIAGLVGVILAGLLPILWTGGAGAEVMRRIAAPMVGGMFTAPLLSLFVIPAAYLLIRRRGLKRAALSLPEDRIATETGE